MQSHRLFPILAIWLIIQAQGARAQQADWLCEIDSTEYETYESIASSTPNYHAPTPIDTLNALVIYSVGINNPSDALPPWYADLGHPQAGLGNFYGQASLGKHIVNVDVVTKDAQRAFRAADSLSRGGLIGVTLPQSYVLSVLNSADSVYDFGLSYNDGPDGQPNSGDDDGFVDVVYFMILFDPLNSSKGTIGLPLPGAMWTSRDSSANGG